MSNINAFAKSYKMPVYFAGNTPEADSHAAHVKSSKGQPVSDDKRKKAASFYPMKTEMTSFLALTCIMVIRIRSPGFSSIPLEEGSSHSIIYSETRIW